jgi:hypothetical protein
VRVITSIPAPVTSAVSSDFAPPVIDGFYATAAGAGIRLVHQSIEPSFETSAPEWQSESSA